MTVEALILFRWWEAYRSWGDLNRLSRWELALVTLTGIFLASERTVPLSDGYNMGRAFGRVFGTVGEIAGSCAKEPVMTIAHILKPIWQGGTGTVESYQAITTPSGPPGDGWQARDGEACEQSEP